MSIIHSAGNFSKIQSYVSSIYCVFERDKISTIRVVES